MPVGRRAGRGRRLLVRACGAPALVSQIGGQALGLEVLQVRHRERAERAGVVHEQVEAAVAGPQPAHGVDELGAVVGVRDVAGDRRDVVEVAGRLGEPGGVAAVGDDGPAAVVEGVHQGAAEACGAAGDEGKRSVMTSHAVESATSSEVEIKRRGSDLDDDLAEGPALADVGERGGGLLEAGRCGRCGSATSPLTQRSASGLEVRRTFLHDQHSQRATGEPPGQPADREHAEQRPDRATHAPVGAAAEPAPAGRRRPSDARRGPGRGRRRGDAGEVLAPGSRRPRPRRADRMKSSLRGVVDAGDVGAEPLGELDREGAGATAGAVDQHPPTGCGRAVPLSAMAPAWGMVEASAKVEPSGFGPGTTPQRARTRRSRPSAPGCRRTPRRPAGTRSRPRRPRRRHRRCRTPGSGGRGGAARRSARTPANR